MKVTSGSSLSASNELNPIWSQVSRKVFQHTKTDAFVERNGHYDQLIMGCAFKSDLMKKKFSPTELLSGCNHFHPMLTTNGMCHTFNGESLSTIWKPSKIIAAFNKVFNTDNDHKREYFGGAGSVQGEYTER